VTAAFTGMQAPGWSQRVKRDILLFGMLRTAYDTSRVTTLRLGMWSVFITSAFVELSH